MTTVAVVAPRFTEVGGMQNYVRRVVAWLRERPDYDVVVISTHPGRGIREQNIDGLRVILLGTWLTLSNTPVNPLWWWQLRRLYRRLGVDVIDAHSPVPFLADVAVFAAGRRPTVLTYHSGSLVKGGGGPVDAVLRLYERVVLPRVFARSTRLVAVSPVAMTQATGRAALIPPGVDTSVFTPSDEPRGHGIAFVGRLERTSRWKGVHVLIDALAEVATHVPDVHLDVVGDGDARAELEEQARRIGVADRIRWHGALPADGVARVLRSAGVAVLPSLTESESFGMSLIEAMACGTPVIGSDVGGIPHVIRDDVDGLLVPPGNTAALATAIAYVLSDPVVAARLGRAGRDAAERTWDWSHQEEATMTELDAALHSAAAASGKPLRLAVVTDVVAPWHTGGKEQRQEELFTRLARRGIDVHVYTMHWWDSGKSVVRDGVTYHAICPHLALYTKGRRSILQAVVFALSTLRMITRRFDVLEVDAIPFLQLFPARVIATLRRRPMVTTWHEYWGQQYWTDYLGPLGRIAAGIERIAIRLPDRILAASEGTAERLRAVGGGHGRPLDVQVVVNGIGEIPGATSGTSAEPWTPERELRLLFAGRLLDHKKVDVAIDATKLLRERGIPAHLTVVGAGPAEPSLQAHAADAGLGDAVEFLAFLPEHRDVLALMGAADLFVFPSVREGFGMAPLEAMATGTPVITSDHADNFSRHLIEPGRNGTLAAPTAESFADAIEALLPRLPELSAGALATALDYDWEHIADQAAQAYVLD